MFAPQQGPKISFDNGNLTAEQLDLQHFIPTFLTNSCRTALKHISKMKRLLVCMIIKPY
jgi:hypothetical protein